MTERNAYIDQKEREIKARPTARLALEVTKLAADLLARVMTQSNDEWESDAKNSVLLRETVDRLLPWLVQTGQVGSLVPPRKGRVNG